MSQTRQRCMMATLLALVATVLTSFLPIPNKRILRDAHPALVAWVTNAVSLPILAAGTGNAATHPVLDYLSAWGYLMFLYRRSSTR
jgi:hypothetical protein